MLDVPHFTNPVLKRRSPRGAKLIIESNRNLNHCVNEVTLHINVNPWQTTFTIHQFRVLLDLKVADHEFGFKIFMRLRTLRTTRIQNVFDKTNSASDAD